MSGEGRNARKNLSRFELLLMLDLIEGVESSVDVVDGESDEVFGLRDEVEESDGSLLGDGVRVRSEGRGGRSKASLGRQKIK